MGAAMQIASVPGIDGLFVGPGDHAVALCHGGDVSHPEVKELMTEVGGYCRRAGIPLGTVLATPEAVAWAYAIGFNFVSHASDLGLLMGAAKTGLSRIHALTSDTPMTDPPTIIAPTAY